MTWQQQLPLALSVARKTAGRCPLPIDVESVAMEALWTAHAEGKPLSRAYVCMRVRGAVIDEMRRLGIGSRRLGWVSQSDVLDIDDVARWLPTDSADLEGAIDNRRALSRMPEAAQYMIGELAAGRSQQEIASAHRVTGARVSQVLTRLKADPSKVTKAPGRVELLRELRLARDAALRNYMKDAPSNRSLSEVIGTSATNVHNWTSGSVKSINNLRGGGSSAVHAAVRQRAIELVVPAFQRAGGSPTVASKLLGVSVMTAWRWGQVTGAGIDGRKRNEFSTEEMVRLQAQGLTHQAIADKLGCNRRLVSDRIGRHPRAASRARPRARKES